MWGRKKRQSSAFICVLFRGHQASSVATLSWRNISSFHGAIDSTRYSNFAAPPWPPDEIKRAVVCLLSAIFHTR